MLSRRSFRHSKRSWLRTCLTGFIIALFWDLYNLYSTAPVERVGRSWYPEPSERYFIASIHWNNEKILRSHWVQAVVDLIKHLGPDNTFTAVLESGSWDDSKSALRELDAELAALNAPRNIILDDTTHADEMSHVPSSAKNQDGWIFTPREKLELRRIPYLSRLRNSVMANMLAPNVSTADKRPFTKVIWLNDVVFSTEDILTLLNTRSGVYAAACSLDFSRPPAYYDTFALRDASGNKAVTHTWPYFASGASRRALMHNAPVPVQSCWNGIVAMDAAPFYDPEKPLRFRGITDSLALHHLEGSECCLIHVDNPISATKGVWLNPNVRVGYNGEAYEIVKATSHDQWPSTRMRVIGLWKNRISRIIGLPGQMTESAEVWRRVRKWKGEKNAEKAQREEDGVPCLINEMQVLISNGWKHL